MFNRRPFLYILVDKTPVPCINMRMWGEWCANRDNRLVAFTKVNNYIEVSTVFLGMNHAWKEGPPILFETMVFGGDMNEYQRRYCTWKKAESGHWRTVSILSGEIKHEQ